jgi:hypothetical protein
MWWMSGRIEVDEVTRRVVVQVDVTDARRSFWLVVEPDDVSVCYTDPGYPVEVVLAGPLPALYDVWLGSTDLLDAVRAGTVDLHGDSRAVAAVPRMFQLSPVAPQVRAARA